MLNSFPVSLLIGTVLGTLSSLGIGGGSLLMLWLTLVLRIPQETARGMNLLFYVPGALIATILHFRKQKPEWKPLLAAIVGGCCAAVAGSVISMYMDTGFLRKIMGGLFILIGIREICYRPRNAR